MRSFDSGNASLNHFFAFTQATQGNAKSSYRRGAHMVNLTTGEAVRVDYWEVAHLIKEWAFFTGQHEPSITDEMGKISSDDMKTLFKGLVENKRAGTVTSEYIVEQCEQFGLALQALRALP